jgi:hypothetical protein
MLIFRLQAIQPESSTSEWSLVVQKVFSVIVSIIAFIVEYFTLPVISLVILIAAIVISRRGRESKWGFYMGLGLSAWIIGTHYKGYFPNYSLFEVSFPMILVCSIVSFVLGFGFLWMMGKVANKPVFGLFVFLMTVMSICSFYGYYSSKPLQPYLFTMTPAIFVGGCFYEILFGKKDKV